MLLLLLLFFVRLAHDCFLVLVLNTLPFKSCLMVGVSIKLMWFNLSLTEGAVSSWTLHTPKCIEKCYLNTKQFLSLTRLTRSDQLFGAFVFMAAKKIMNTCCWFLSSLFFFSFLQIFITVFPNHQYWVLHLVLKVKVSIWFALFF